LFVDNVEKKLQPSEMPTTYSSVENINFNPGRRSWIKYRDLGVEAATGGQMRAEVMHIDDVSSSKPTGWHYHTSDMQFIMVIKGWLKIEFPEGVYTLQEGESLFVPNGVVHQELCSSEPFRLLEISLPAKLGTVAVDEPDWARERAEQYGNTEPVVAGFSVEAT
jgi:mannose-6-phosphate isomerase-like protein (cupin superfamily)